MRRLIESIAIAIIFGILLAGISTAHAEDLGSRNNSNVYGTNQGYVVYSDHKYKPKKRKWNKHRGRGYYEVRPYVGWRSRPRYVRYVRVWRLGRYVTVRRYY